MSDLRKPGDDDMKFVDGMTLREARDKLRELLINDNALNCPCCTQRAQVYKRQIHASMARELIKAYRIVTPGSFFRAFDVRQHSAGDFAKLSYWGLIEEEKARREDGGRSGWWCVTSKGEAFIRGHIVVPKICRVYNGKALGFREPLISIRDALGKRFDYDELMRGEG